jgi:mono/diheme cytochrome c family protein
MDWQQFYAGAWLFPIKMKFVLASFLLILLILAVIFSLQAQAVESRNLLIYLLCLLNVVFLGFFGGQLVYGVKEPAGAESQGAAASGALVFQQNCAACHHADSTDSKIGPGLKGIFKQDEFPVSGWPANEENFRKQLKTPFSKMPSFAQLSDEQIDELIAYLKSH